jgi:hypothetical protein
VRHDVRVARRPGRYVALAVAVALGAGACGTASDPSPPSGVDELVIPTPSPDPSDFVPAVDNPWFPLKAGSSWTYRASGTPTGTVTVRVLSSPVPIAGVTTTALERTDPSGAATVDYYAQDRHGNVWWFGREGEWRAREAGAEAGLAMPEHPRRGDGWRTAYQPGVVEDQASVASVDDDVTTPAGKYDDLVVLDTSSPLTPGVAMRSFYARGVGLVEAVATEGPISLLELETGP